MWVAGYSERAVAALAFLAMAAAPAWAREGAGGADPATLCRQATARVERLERLPRQYLGAIALAESGRWDAARQETIAWPWTVHAEGRGRYLVSKTAAVAEVRALRARGVGNIDVGCMQINLLHHRGAFASLEAAFDPGQNVAYAARFIDSLRRETRSWSLVTAFYHSRTRELYLPYRKKVFKLWRQERRRVAEERRQRRLEEWQRRREARLAALDESGSALIGPALDSLSLPAADPWVRACAGAHGTTGGPQSRPESDSN